MMNVKIIRQWIASSVAVGLGLFGVCSANAAIASSPTDENSRTASPLVHQSMQLAQQADTCRRADVQVGIYQEPNVTSPAVGVVGAGDYILLGNGSGGGWVRVTAPAIGWVEARYLLGNDSTPCPVNLRPSSARPESETPEVETSEPEMPESEEPDFPPANQPTSPAPEVIVEEPTTPSTVVTRTAICTVTPQAGLVVRSRPLILSATVIGNLPSGRQTIEFTNRTVTTETTEGTRQWVYITSPTEGWISPGFVGDTSNLIGPGCSVS